MTFRCGILLLPVAVALGAEQIQARFTSGLTSFADDRAVNHFSIGGGVRFHLSRRWSVEPEYLYSTAGSRHHDSLLWGSFAYDFRDRRRSVVPYWFAGPGLVRTTDQFSWGGFSSHEAAFGTGAGARIFLSPALFLAPQFRAGIANGVFFEVTGSVGFVLRK